jgi:hypothetical protein
LDAYRPSRQQLAGTVVVLIMAALAVGTIDALNDWVGDVGALLWLCAGYWFPFIFGIALARMGMGLRGRVIGALVAAAFVIVPTVGYVLVERPHLYEVGLPTIWTLFIPLSMAMGAIAMPVGASVRAKPKT